MLLAIIRQIELIKDHRPSDLVEFRSDATAQAAILTWLRIIGEAARGISPQVKAVRAELRSRELVDFRNLVRAYDQVDLRKVWRYLECDLPKLETEVRASVEWLE